MPHVCDVCSISPSHVRLLSFAPGWMESTPSVLQWLLDHRPQGFPLTTLPLWQITSSFLTLIPCSGYSNLGPFMHLLGPMVEATAGLSTAYLLYLESCTANRSVVQPMCYGIINCRLAVMATLGISALPDVPATLPMLANSAVQELALCMVASFCQHQHVEHSRRQQQQQQQQQRQHQHGGRSRQSRNSGGVATTASSCSSSSTFADLVIPPDHKMLTVAGGQYAVALHAEMLQQNMPANAGFDTCTRMAMGYLNYLTMQGRRNAATDDSTSAMVYGTAAEPSVLTVPSTQQLLLELTALLWSAGAQKDGLDCMLLLWHCWDHAEAENVGALVAARGPLLLQVLFLAIREGWAAQQQGLFPSKTTENLLFSTVVVYIATMEECKTMTGLGLGVHRRVLPFGFVLQTFDLLRVWNSAAIEV